MAKNKKRFFGEFKEFILRGNVMDLAVAVIIGGAFQKIISSLVDDVIMPVIGLITGGIDFSNLFISLNGIHYETLAEAKAAEAATLNYGSFITVVINFLIMAFIIFLMVKGMNALASRTYKQVSETAPAPTTKICPFCKSEIASEAVKCPHCTSELIEE